MAGHYIVTGDGGMGIYGSPNNPTGQHERLAAHRPDVPRHGRSAQPVLDLSRSAGRRQHAHRERSADRAGERAVLCAAARGTAPAGGGRGGGGRGGGAGAAAGGRGGAAGGGAAAVVEPRVAGPPVDAQAAVAAKSKLRAVAVAVVAAADAAADPGRTRAGRHAVVRIRVHVSRAEQPSVRLGHLLRRARRDVRRAERPAPLGQPVDAHARSRSGRPEVPLSLVAAAGDRLVRQLGLLRLPGDLPHARSRSELGGHQSGPLDQRSEPHRLLRRRRRRQPRTVLWRASSRRSRRRALQQGAIWAGTNDGKVWISRDAGKRLERSDART